MRKTCAICGNPSGMYPLCPECFKLRDEGKVEKCEKCGKWHRITNPCDCEDKQPKKEEPKNEQNKKKQEETAQKEETFCIVCGQPSNGKVQCKTCWNETKDYSDGLDKNKDLKDFRDHYYSLKDAIFRMHDFEIVKTNCNKLFAIAATNEKSNNDTLLSSLVQKDVTRLIEQKKPKKEEPIPEQVTQKDEQKTNILTAQDGHKVKSGMEQTIDDTLWNANILHSYEPDIIEITSKNKKADWYIPIIGTGA